MKVMICGATVLGVVLADSMNKAGHKVTLIDKNQDKLNLITARVPIYCVVGDVTKVDTLKQGGIGDVDVVIAATNYDERNIMVCHLAQAFFNVKFKIAGLHGNLAFYADNKNDVFAVDYYVSLEQVIAFEICEKIYYLNVQENIPILSDRVVITSFVVSDDVHNVKVKKINTILKSYQAKLCAIFRDHKTYLFTDEKFHEMSIAKNDKVLFIMPKNQEYVIIDKLGFVRHGIKNILLIGDADTISVIMRKLSQLTHDLFFVIIEEDEDKAMALANEFDRTEVLCGNITDAGIVATLAETAIDLVCLVDVDEKSNLFNALVTATFLSCGIMAFSTNDIVTNILKKSIDFVSNHQRMAACMLHSFLAAKYNEDINHKTKDQNMTIKEVVVAGGYADFAGSSTGELCKSLDVLTAPVIMRNDKILFPDNAGHILAKDDIVALIDICFIQDD